MWVWVSILSTAVFGVAKLTNLLFLFYFAQIEHIYRIRWEIFNV
jgi:hypothetical protein